jgi:hypothetical protein
MAVSIPIVSEFVGDGVQKAIAEFKKLETTGQKAQFALKKSFVPAVAVLGGLTAAAVPAVQAASDLNETISKTSVIFGEADEAIFDFADNAASSLGQTRQQALDAAATFGTFGKAAGLTGKELGTFSTDFTKLASDLASFNNTTPEEAVVALGAALRGESEPMRRFGVLLSADAVAAKALSMGLVTATVDMDKVNIATQKADIAFQKHTETVNKYGENSIEAAKTSLALEQAENRLAAAVDGTNDKLSASAKTLATQALIMEATKDAQGDFARTSDGLANSQRILTAQVKDLQAELGSILLPIVEKGVQLLSAFTGAMAANKDIVVIAIAVIGSLAAAIVAANVAMKVYQATLVAVKVAQAVLNFVMSANPIGLVIIAVGALVAAFVILEKRFGIVSGAIKFLGEQFYNWIINPLKTIIDLAGKAASAVGKIAGGIGGAISAVIPGLADGGIVTSPTLAMIGEGGEPEAVIPLSQLDRYGGGGGTHITINSTVADDRLGDVIVNALRQYNRRSGPISIAVA